MTEREIPDNLEFLFSGMTDDSIALSAPPSMSEPENPFRGAAPTGAAVSSPRREARAAAEFSTDAAASALATPAATLAPPAYEGIASLFPLLGEVTVSPVESPLPAPSAFDAILAPPPAELEATQAMPVAEVAAELATPVGAYVVPQSAPVAISIVPETVAPLQPPSWHVADAFGFAPAGLQPDSWVSTRRSLRAAAASAQPGGRQKLQWRRKPAPRDRVANRQRPEDDRKPLRQRVFGVGVMVLVGGLFAVLALPAYADNDATALTAAAAVQTQKVAVAGAAASTISTTARDGYTATSAADLKSLYAAAMRQQNMDAYLQSGAKAKGDDYPWFAELSRNQGGGLSPIGYYYRECVDFVAWRLNRDAGSTRAPFKWTWSTLTPNGGDGHQWKAAWLAHGWATGTTPKPGAVAWFGDNHVGYVNGILDNGQVLVEEYNYVPHAYGTRVINSDQAYYLYAPPA